MSLSHKDAAEATPRLGPLADHRVLNMAPNLRQTGRLS
jgi:hypothetical protein